MTIKEFYEHELTVHGFAPIAAKRALLLRFPSLAEKWVGEDTSERYVAALMAFRGLSKADLMTEIAV